MIYWTIVLTWTDFHVVDEFGTLHLCKMLWVVQYVPYVGDSKRAMDEYTSEIFMGGRNTIVMHNTCEDSLLAAPLILDLVLLAELCTRITFKEDGEVCTLFFPSCYKYCYTRTP